MSVIEKHEQEFKWRSSVRVYELDSQGIVNNSVYLDYFNHARIEFLNTFGINWFEESQKGFEFVLFESNLQYKYPLRLFDEFTITSSLKKIGKLILEVKQTLYNETESKVSAYGVNQIVCVNKHTGKPIYHKQVEDKIFNQL